MDTPVLHSVIEKFFLDKNFESQGEETGQEIDLRYREGDIDWAIALCADQPSEMEYLKAFESGMQTLISYRQTRSEAKLALALSFESTLRGQTRSYRRALNKYSNSIVFEDLGIHLLLAYDDGEVEKYSPGEINSFLRKLNVRIAAEKSQR